MPEITTQSEEFAEFARGQLLTLSSGKDEKGGFLIPKSIALRFQKMLDEYSILRRLARVETISTDTLDILKDQGEADCGWVHEMDFRPITKSPEFTKQKIEAHELYAKPIVTQKLLEDAMIDLEPWLLEKIAIKMAKMENEAFLRGDGIQKPKGVLAYRDQFASIREENIVSAFINASFALKPQYLKNACFFISHRIMSLIQTLKDPATGRFLFQQSLSQSAPATFLGYPIILSEEMNSEKHAIFGSFYDGYQIVDRLGFSLIRDPFSMKPFVEFYARKRVGGDVIDPAAFCLIEALP